MTASSIFMAERIEVTPTLLHPETGREVERVEGWDRDGWRTLKGLAQLGTELPGVQAG